MIDPSVSNVATVSDVCRRFHCQKAAKCPSATPLAALVLALALIRVHLPCLPTDDASQGSGAVC